MSKMSLKEALQRRAHLVATYVDLQHTLLNVRLALRELPFVGHLRPQVVIELCRRCGQPFSARDIRKHEPHCKGKLVK